MSDLVERLRHLATTDDGCSPYTANGPLVTEAADEIIRLREEIDRLKDRMVDMMPIAGGNPMRPKNMRGGSATSQRAAAQKEAGPFTNTEPPPKDKETSAFPPSLRTQDEI